MNKIYYVQSSWEDSPKVFTDSREKAEKYLLAYGKDHYIGELNLDTETDINEGLTGYYFKYHKEQEIWSLYCSSDIYCECDLEIDYLRNDVIFITVPKNFANDILEAYNVAEYMLENRDIPDIVEHMKNIKLGAQLYTDKIKRKELV